MPSYNNLFAEGVEILDKLTKWTPKKSQIKKKINKRKGQKKDSENDFERRKTASSET